MRPLPSPPRLAQGPPLPSRRARLLRGQLRIAPQLYGLPRRLGLPRMRRVRGWTLGAPRNPLLRRQRLPLPVHLLEPEGENLILAGDGAEARAPVERRVREHVGQFRHPRLRAADLSLELRQPLLRPVFPPPIRRCSGRPIPPSPP